MMAEWKNRANRAIGADVLATIQQSLNQQGERPLAAADLSPETLDAYGAATVLTLQNKRATWTRWNLLAEAARQTRLLRLVSSSDRFDVLQSIVERAEQHSINLTAPDLVAVPTARANGESIFTIHNGQIYTSPVILGAEAVLLDLARDPSGPKISGRRVQTDDLSADKVRALHRVTTSGQKVEALRGPAGTGKTNLLSALSSTWQTAHGEGSIIALAPSSAASTILSDAIGAPTENIAKWIYESAGLGAEIRRQRIQETEYAAHLAHRSRRRRRHQNLTIQLACLRAEDDRWTFHKNQLVIVDEASMAGTMELATLARATDRPVQLDDEPLDVFRVLDERCQRVPRTADEFGHDRRDPEEATEDEVLRSVGVLGETQEVLGVAEVVVLVPLPVAVHVQPVLGVLSEQQIPRLGAAHPCTDVELDLRQLRLRHRDEVREPDQCPTSSHLCKRDTRRSGRRALHVAKVSSPSQASIAAARTCWQRNQTNTRRRANASFNSEMP
ncbi:AAA family ATPase [Kribbella sp. NPDC058245]|uniref:AAA family ATPase n=1 Tax=Kribbella sp. NPDC058245 TaxID=3346399 RepID=UPI0036E0D1AB